MEDLFGVLVFILNPRRGSLTILTCPNISNLEGRVKTIAAGLCTAIVLALPCCCQDQPAASANYGSAPSRAPGQDDGRPGALWSFVVSGDSRNCGDVVVPAIAHGAHKDGATFYWHLGDLRAIYDFDEDMLQEAAVKRKHPAKEQQADTAKQPQAADEEKLPLTIIAYENDSWEDFKRNQIAPFDQLSIPYYVGIGNHETIPPKSRCEFANSFRAWLDKPELRDKLTPASSAQPSRTGAKLPAKAAENEASAKTPSCPQCSNDAVKTYYHFVKAGVDFIFLDNATGEQFDQPQLSWLDRVLNADRENKSITTVVVGMHKALPWSVTCDHSMNETPDGTRSGTEVYRKLLRLQKDKKVYVLASHSHYFMRDIYDTPHWQQEGVLPGWIIGTAGAQRYPLPPGADLSKSRTHVYGYLLGRVYDDGSIDFAFTEVKEDDVPDGVNTRYTKDWIRNFCFNSNYKQTVDPEPAYCKGTEARH